MEDKTTDVVNNICTILGAALLLKPIVDEAAKTFVPEMEKLTSRDITQDLKQLPLKEEKHEPTDDLKYEAERKKDDEIIELKRKLAELESKSNEHKSEN